MLVFTHLPSAAPISPPQAPVPHLPQAAAQAAGTGKLTCFLQSDRDGVGRANAHDVRRNPDHRIGPQDPQDGKAQLFCLRPPGQQDGSGPITHLARVSWRQSTGLGGLEATLRWSTPSPSTCLVAPAPRGEHPARAAPSSATPSPVSPAVVEPPLLKAGFSLARPSMVVPGRMPSSWATVTLCSVPLSSRIVVVTGTISAWKQPWRWALAALPAPWTARLRLPWGYLPSWGPSLRLPPPALWDRCASSGCYMRGHTCRRGVCRGPAVGPPPAWGVGAQGLKGPFWSSALSDLQGGGLSRGPPSKPFTQEGLSQPEAGAPGIFVLASVDFSVPSHQPNPICFLCFIYNDIGTSLWSSCYNSVLPGDPGCRRPRFDPWSVHPTYHN